MMFTIKKSPIGGIGTFALRNIERGEILIHISDQAPQPFNFVNHSCNPNSIVINGSLAIMAVKNISKGEEITVDYTVIEIPLLHYSFKCNCGSDSCKKKIEGGYFI